MLNFVKIAFRGLIVVFLWVNLVVFGVGGGFIGNIISGGGSNKNNYIVGFIFIGIIAGFLINIIVGGLIANFISLCENVELLVENKGSSLEENKIWKNKYVVLDSIELKRSPDSNDVSISPINKGEIIEYLNDVYEEIKTKIIWHKVKFNNFEGWCNSKNIEKFYN